jgi:membrane protein involved in colicin uptake
MAQSSKPKANKLLRVLVAGGVALAGVAGTARAEDQPPAESGKAPRPADKAAEQEKAKQEKAKAAEKAKAEAKAKAAQSDGGGVKGW